MSIFDERGNVRPGRTWLYILLVLALIVVVPIAVWQFKVSTAHIKGNGDVVRQNQDSTNRIAAQNEFNRLWGDIQAYRFDIDSAARQVAADVADKTDSTEDRATLTGLQQTCRTAVQTYNADTQNMTLKDWRPSGDPSQIDTTQECEVAS